MPLRPVLSFALCAGTVAAAVSEWTLARRGRRDTGRAAAAINAPSHWLWGEEAIRRDGLDLRHTAVGTAVHWASALLWSTAFAVLRARRRAPGPGNAIIDAAAVAAVAAWVDLRVVPCRFTPGFERRLSGKSLLLVYAGFAAGLAAAELARGARPRHDARSCSRAAPRRCRG